MKIIQVLLFLSICFFNQLLDKDEFYLNKCMAVSNIIEKKDTFDIKIVSNFLIDRPLNNHNVEYGEWSNELLYNLIEYYPKEMLKLLSTLTESQKDSVYNELRTPIHDGFDYVKIKNGINSVKGYDVIKKELNDIFNVFDCH